MLVVVAIFVVVITMVIIVGDSLNAVACSEKLRKITSIGMKKLKANNATKLPFPRQFWRIFLPSAGSNLKQETLNFGVDGDLKFE